MTTLGVNVGDEFIREGIGSFLDEIFDNWKPFYVNKHNLATLHERVADESDVLKDKFFDADIIIQAGAPVYWKLGESTSYNVEWAEELWRKRIFKLGPIKPILNIAAGACQPYPDTAETFIADPACVKFAEEVSAACRWTSVRDPLASQILQALNLVHDVLPCTAFHAARRIKSVYALNGMLGINLMPLGGHYKFKDDIDSNLWSNTIEKFLADLRKRHRLLFIAHDLKEKEFMGHYIAEGETIFHSADYHDYMAVYAQCAAVIANRVHGAVCAAGFGKPSVIIGNDTRLQIGDYIDIPARYVGSVSAEEIIDLLEMSLVRTKNEKDRLLTLREDSAKRYRDAIIKNIDDNGGNRPAWNIMEKATEN